ncbi:VOC family protein [Streptomyces sp. WM6378]|uniref:VOC family protein n=1 Tax=Streptomyces sp. WM6378 TaxID=1415557 RepID=UPI0006AECAFD|nr:VOC family protein [Streptomyces sp. WM6378]KOU49141.1 glyoxalase [Streptomyces sp. WM6378]
MPKVSGPYAPGTPCWVDLMVPDQQAALDFYRDLFGWQGEVGPPETGGYALCSLNGQPVAGIMAAMNPDGSTPDPMPPTVWTTYLATADLDATEKKSASNGGQVMVPGMDVMTLGRMAVASDPTGAVFGLWQAKDFPGAGIVNEPGAIIWNELNTSDTDAASSYYSKTLGITAAAMEEADGYFALNVDGRTVGGMQALSGIDGLPPGTPSHWLTYFAVDDTDSTVDALIRAGGTVLKPPFDMMAGRMAVVQDPQGGVFAIIKATGPEAA